jgi:hypothetical protein
MQRDPVFILGTERSGSNLLRLILNAHPAILIPHPPHVVRYFHPMIESYGDLSEERALGRLVDDVLELVRAHIHPWEWIPDRAEILTRADPRDLFGVYYALHESLLPRSEKRRWGCKSTFMIDHAERLLRDRPGARFILLVRDPRDVAVSSRQSVFSTFHPLNTARLWRAQQQRGLELLDRLPREHLRLLRYEDLLAAPEAEIRALCAFLGEEFHASTLRFFETEEARRSSALSASWKNTASPILAGNTGRFRATLSPDELRLVEHEVGELMERFGYTREASPGPMRVPGTARLTLEETRLRLQVELASARTDRNWRLRWRRSLLLRELAIENRARRLLR